MSADPDLDASAARVWAYGRRFDGQLAADLRRVMGAYDALAAREAAHDRRFAELVEWQDRARRAEAALDAILARPVETPCGEGGTAVQSSL